jgi:hypothetical protein
VYKAVDRTCPQAGRHAGVQHACRKEVQRYVDKRALIQHSTVAAEREIEEAKLALQQAQVVRHHEEEYEVRGALPAASQRDQPSLGGYVRDLCTPSTRPLRCTPRLGQKCLTMLSQLKRAEIMRQMGRPATAVEAGSVREEVATIQAESVHLDDVLAVCIPALP